MGGGGGVRGVVGTGEKPSSWPSGPFNKGRVGVELGVEFELLATIPFDSDRKRMSVVIRRLSDRKVFVYCKGADNVILDRTISFLGAENPYTARQTMSSHLSSFASEGLRTLLFACRELTEEELNTFQVAWVAAEVAVVGRYAFAAVLLCSLFVINSSVCNFHRVLVWKVHV